MLLYSLKLKERMMMYNVADHYYSMARREQGNQFWIAEFQIIKRYAILGFLTRRETETITTAMESYSELIKEKPYANYSNRVLIIDCFAYFFIFF